MSSVNETTADLSAPVPHLSWFLSILKHFPVPWQQLGNTGSRSKGTTWADDATDSHIASDALKQSPYFLTQRENDYIVSRTQGQMMCRVGMAFIFLVLGRANVAALVAWLGVRGHFLGWMHSTEFSNLPFYPVQTSE